MSIINNNHEMKETSSRRIVKEAGIGQAGKRDLANTASEKLVQALSLAPGQLESPLMDKMSEINDHSKRIKKQAEHLSTKTQQLQNHVRQWASYAQSVDIKLKEMGDLQNWTEMLEQEMRVLEDVIKSRSNNNN